jgi:acyl-homoserine-lactone acylase
MKHVPRTSWAAAILALAIVISAAEAADASRWAKQVVIHRDEWGVPHIKGPTDASVVFGVAYAQCEDYFWQVEDTYLQCIGRYAEVNGEDALQSDMIHRLFGITELAKKNYRELPSDVRELCDAYAAGYNYFLETNPDVKPRLITEFEPYYVICYDKFMMLQRLLGRAHAPSGRVRDLLEAEMEAAIGSNAWAIHGSKTKSGNPMLFVNPHQPWFGSGQFTEMHVVSGEGWNFSGSTFPGGPFPTMGHNEYLGWTHTVNEPDVGDVYRETFDHPDDPLKYKYADGYMDAESWEDTITVKTDEGMETRTYTFRKTHHGPVIAKEDDTHYLSVKIAKFEDGSRILQARAMTKATNFDEWYAAMGQLRLQMFNTVYADVKGNIFYIYNGAVPRRDPSFDWTKPVDGSDPRTEWHGIHALTELPQTLNPPSGYVQNCNQSPFTTTDEGNPSPSISPITWPRTSTTTNAARKCHGIYCATPTTLRLRSGRISVTTRRCIGR